MKMEYEDEEKLRLRKEEIKRIGMETAKEIKEAMSKMGFESYVLDPDTMHFDKLKRG